MLTVLAIGHQWYTLISIEVDRCVKGDMPKVFTILITFAALIDGITFDESDTALGLAFGLGALFIAIRLGTHFLFNFGSNATVLTAVCPVILFDREGFELLVFIFFAHLKIWS